jgi:hypothetical protein
MEQHIGSLVARLRRHVLQNVPPHAARYPGKQNVQLGKTPQMNSGIAEPAVNGLKESLTQI